MSNPSRSTIFEGNFDVIDSPYQQDQGLGVLTVSNSVVVKGNLPSTDTNSGSLQVTGGTGITGDLHVGSTLHTTGAANFSSSVQSASLNVTGTGPPSTVSVGVDGPISMTSNTDAFNINGAANSNVTTSGTANLSVASALGQLNLSGGNTSVKLSSANGLVASASGNMSVISTGPSLLGVESDTNSNLLIRRWGSTATANSSTITLSNERGTSNNAINLVSTIGGLSLSANTGLTANVSNGAWNILGSGAASKLALASVNNADNLIVALTGSTTAQLQLQSSTTTNSAINIAASVGGITNSAVTGFAVGVSAGNFSIASTAGPTSSGSSILATTQGNGQDMTVGVNCSTANNSRLVLSGAGSVDDAVLISASNSGVTCSAISSFNARVTSGPFILSATGGSSGSSMTYNALTTGRDFTMQLTGAYDNRLRLLSSGTGASALDLVSSAGGVSVTANKGISVQSSDAVNGISIGTANANVPVFIGNGSSSTVTIGNNLVVAGNIRVVGSSTIVESDSLAVSDNFVICNSGPSGSSDAGILFARYQSVAASTSGDCVQDTPDATGAVVSATATTVKLAANSSPVMNFYQGYWIKILTQVRRIKSYDAGTKIATIYGTADTDQSGKDFVTIPSANDPYSLYGHTYASVFYSESDDTMQIAYTASDPGRSRIAVSGRPNTQVGGLIVDRSIVTDTINRNTTTGVTVEGVTVSSGALTNVTTINGSSLNKTVSVSLTDNAGSTAGVDLPISAPGPYTLMIADTVAGGCNAIFMISKSSAASVGIVNRLVSSAGSNGQRIDCLWNSNALPRLYYSVKPGDSSTRSFNVKIITV